MNTHTIDYFSVTPLLAYLTGVIVGDGHIARVSRTDPKYRISIELVDQEYVECLARLFSFLTGKRHLSRPTGRSRGTKPSYMLQIHDKSLHYCMTELLGVPAGKKSGIVRVPAIILSEPVLASCFVGGLFDTDGGFRGAGLGFTSKSPDLMAGVSSVLERVHIKHSCDSWTHKSYTSMYFGIKIWKRDVGSFLKQFFVLNNSKCDRIRKRFSLWMCRSGQTGCV